MRLASSDFACFFGVFFGWRKKLDRKEQQIHVIKTKESKNKNGAEKVKT